MYSWRCLIFTSATVWLLAFGTGWIARSILLIW